MAGGGYYGGGGTKWHSQGGGGSSFISGHNGCDAITAEGTHTGQSIHYSNLYFTNTIMIDGGGYEWTNTKQALRQMPSKVEGEYYESSYGNAGDGFARITLLSAEIGEFPVANIITSKGAFSKEFSPDNSIYYIELDSEETTVEVSVELNEENAIIESGSEGTIIVQPGQNEHKVKVIAEDGIEYEYTLIFIREPSDYKYLDSITIDGIEIEGFNPEKLNYEIIMPYDSKDFIEVDAVKARPDQVVDGIDIYDISYNNKMIILDVLSEDKQNITKYTISVKKENTTKLKFCDIENQAFSDIFEPDKYEYEFEVTTGIVSLNINAEPYNSEAKVTIKGAGYIKEGRNLVTITVSKEGMESTCYNIYVLKGENLGEVEYDFDYTGGYQTFIAPAVGYYKFELWGAQGTGDATSGRGGYVSGIKKLNQGDTFYVYVGSKNAKGGWNGGGKGNSTYGGGGATDIRIVSGDWDNYESLKSRIMVAGGGRRTL